MAWLDDGNTGPPRVAFAIARRIGGAVVRNRLRRRLRELARRSALPEGVWMVSAARDVPSYADLARWWDGAVAELVASR